MLLPAEQRDRVDVCAPGHGRCRHHRVGEDLDHRLGRRVDSAALSFVASPRGPQRLESLTVSGSVERVAHLVGLLLVHPAHHVGHGAAGYRCGQQQRRQQLGGGGVPEVAVGECAG